MSYQEFPKVMKHPAHRPAVIAKWDPRKPAIEQPIGKPEAFPDVIVRNVDQELDYASRGYAPAGVSDPEAYRRLVTGNEEVPAEKFKAYPKWLYRKATKAVAEGEDVESQLVATKADEEKLGAGWHPTPGAARAAAEVKKEVAPAKPKPAAKKKAAKARKAAPKAAEPAPEPAAAPAPEKPAKGARKPAAKPQQLEA